MHGSHDVPGATCFGAWGCILGYIGSGLFGVKAFNVAKEHCGYSEAKQNEENYT